MSSQGKFYAVIIGAVVLVSVLLGVFNDNIGAKKYGGEMTINVPAGNKVTNITWKDGDLWYAFRPFEEGEEPCTQTFVEESTFGLMEGKVTFIESN